MVIGITGPTGAGKSTISKFICDKFGYTLIDADVIARCITKKGEKALEEIALYFGEEFIINGELDRKHLAQVVFNNKEKLNKLNEITHKYITKRVEEVILNNDKCIVDAPLLFESGLNELCQKIILVLSDEEVRMRRIIERDKLEPEIAKSRIKAQNNYELYKGKSDIVIYNNDKINLSDILAEVGNW